MAKDRPASASASAPSDSTVAVPLPGTRQYEVAISFPGPHITKADVTATSPKEAVDILVDHFRKGLGEPREA